MSKRKRYRDRTKADVAPVVMKYIQGEGGKSRHARRLQTNVAQFAEAAREWAEANSIHCRITNGNHHWKFMRESKVVEWWPSSAKCVIGKQWKKGIHVHEWPQLLIILKREFKIEGAAGC